ncbi:hypothetical protein GCM10007094_13630 [Pseudovibrio japonicus]|uniref:Alpha/beta hydrolase n=1 Tax=Pseudovibrio japonicus TaxID=366534 RepID=A0ABQ3E854_9HYPH|nr:hypothetical protein [Pseudovibrio japonicus]GHB26597.1 hypothetical protein GCM10007094_13630 [Pseudovibrio japonicus]
MSDYATFQQVSARGLEVKFQSGGHSGVLVVVFSQVRIPSGKFGLERLFAKTQHACVFVNDTRSQWYLNGEGTIDRAIDEAVAREKPERIIYYGASMGAYGALITGLRRQDGEIFAFSPELGLGTAGTQSAAYLEVAAPDQAELLALLSGSLRHPVHLFFGLFDWVDTSGYLAVRTLPSCDNRKCYGVAGPHALHDQLYSLNIVRQLIKTFQRDASKLLADRHLLAAPSVEDCEAFVQLGVTLAGGETIQFTNEPRLVSDNPGYALLKAEHLALQGRPLEGAQLLQDWHHILQNDAVMRTTPKRWRKSFLVRASELYLSSSNRRKAREALIECARHFPIDERMMQLAAQLELDVPATP